MSAANHRRSMSVVWRQRGLLLLGGLMILVGVFTLVDYYRFTTCQAQVNEQSYHVDQVRSAALERSLDAQIGVARALLSQDRMDSRQETQSALQQYLDALVAQRQVRDAFERPEPAQCR